MNTFYHCCFRAHSRNIPHTQQGLSLLECCITIALLACIVGIGLFHTTLLYKIQARTHLEQLQATLQALQQKALATNIPQTLRVDINHNTYTYDGTTHLLPMPLIFGYPKDALGPPSAPSNPITRACTFQDNSITFWPDGIIKAGTLYITERKKNYAYALSNAVGAVSLLRMYEYKQGKWLCRS